MSINPNARSALTIAETGLGLALRYNRVQDKANDSELQQSQQRLNQKLQREFRNPYA